MQSAVHMNYPLGTGIRFLPDNGGSCVRVQYDWKLLFIGQCG